MSETVTEEQQSTYEAFYDLVNMQPKELEEWLDTEQSKSVGAKDAASSESTGHHSGRRIVEIKRTKKADLSDDDFSHMKKVVGYIKRHTAQRPDGDIDERPWSYSLKNWGHDPTRAE
ncbi:hypothetical protein Pla100_06030 [Neorhodopirellula pilleata]|uniref:DNA-binding protein n=1 Tax=Neorhodopirellula pilleata TaxID=2714738 RepID=A0A5C6AUI3_9BACT|nr:hypothetical protein Pla100_06030 [Neorhodopirellula pilleata]